jgi:hypothetical protein
MTFVASGQAVSAPGQVTPDNIAASLARERVGDVEPLYCTRGWVISPPGSGDLFLALTLGAIA